jgi:CheY-like chemotaxis protein
VLLAEDDGIVRRLAERILRQAGYEVLVAQDGAEALLLSERHRGPIHLLISDVVMPQMNGGELFGHLATSRPETRVLYLSGYTAPSIVQQGLLEGRAEFLQKPFTTEALARKVREVLER